MTNARDKANIPVLNFQSKGIDDNADATAITINSSESVGIGETLPEAKLHVKIGDSGASPNAGGDEIIVEDSAGAGISILSGNTSKGQIIFGDDGDNNVGRLVYDHSNNNLASWTNGFERMRITSAGLVGINNSAPSTELEVYGTIKAHEKSGLAQASILIDATATGNPHLAFQQAGTYKGYIHYLDASDTICLNDGSGNGLHYSPTLQRLGIGTSSPSALLDITGKFSDSVNTNLSLEMGDRWGFRVGTSSTSENLNLDGNLSGTPFTCMTWNKTNGNVIAPLLNTTGSTSNRYPLYWVHSGTVGSIEPYTGSVREMKTDINDMGSVNWIHSLRPRSFKFRDYETDEDGNKVYLETTNNLPNTEYGLIAEEVNEVSGSDYILDKQIDKDGNENLKGVLYHNLVPILLKAVQEQKNTIQELEARITTLEANNT